MKTVGIDIQSTVGQTTGVGVYTHNLVEELKRRPENGIQFRYYSRPVESDLNTPKRLWWENVQLTGMLREDDVDLLHIPAFASPLLSRKRYVMTVHDIIGRVFPNQRGVASSFYWGSWLPMTAKRADALIADSEHTKRDLMRHLKLPEDRIKVIYPSGHEGFEPIQDSNAVQDLKTRLGIVEKYVLFVGTTEPRKNLRAAISAFNAFTDKVQDGLRYQFVIAGKKDFAHGQAMNEVIKKEGDSSQDILWTGYLSHRDLNTLYSGAEVFIFPSLYEGFGIPVLEAMASGCPVIASNATSVPEVSGEAAYSVDPGNAEEMGNALFEVITQSPLRNDLIKKGFERIKTFSWKDTAQKVVEIYKKLI